MPKCKKGESSITLRCSDEQKEAIIKKCEEFGFKTITSYILFVAEHAEPQVKVSK